LVPRLPPVARLPDREGWADQACGAGGRSKGVAGWWIEVEYEEERLAGPAAAPVLTPGTHVVARWSPQRAPGEPRLGPKSQDESRSPATSTAKRLIERCGTVRGDYRMLACYRYISPGLEAPGGSVQIGSSAASSSTGGHHRVAGSSVPVDEDRRRRGARRCAEVDARHVEEPSAEPYLELGVVSSVVGERLLHIAFEPNEQEAPHWGLLQRPGLPDHVDTREMRVEFGAPSTHGLRRERASVLFLTGLDRKHPVEHTHVCLLWRRIGSEAAVSHTDCYRGASLPRHLAPGQAPRTPGSRAHWRTLACSKGMSLGVTAWRTMPTRPLMSSGVPPPGSGGGRP
jgi:hypothetical protein